MHWNWLVIILLCVELNLTIHTHAETKTITIHKDYRDFSSFSSATKLYNYYKLIFYKEGLEHLMTNIVTKVNDDINCLAIINDNVHQDVFGGFFFRRLSDIPYYKVFIEDKEDMKSPNYHTLSVIRHVKRSSCNVYILLMSNGVKISRFLRFGDKYRVIDTRAKFIILHDNQLFHSSLHYLWKKIVNVIFLHQHGRHQQPGAFRRKQIQPWYISTVPFPTPIRRIFIPHQLDMWHQNKFQKDKDLFRDKTSNMKGEILRVVTFQHLPGTVKKGLSSIQFDVIHGNNKEDYGGVELEILWTMAKLMNFKPSVYEAQHADIEKWGRKQLNGSYSGLIGEVKSGQADMALGNLYYTPYYLELMDLTIPYTTECLTFLTPEALTNNSWTTLILPFKPVMWAAVIVAMTLAGFVFYALANYYHYIVSSKPILTKKKIIIVQEKNKKVKFKSIKQKYFDQERGEGLYLFSELVNAILYTYGMLLMVSLPKFPSGWSLRMLTGWFWMYCILLVVSYRASMTAILANPAPRIIIDTLEQLVNAKITCGGWGEEVKQTFLTSLDPAGQRIGLKFEVTYDTDQAIERIAKGEFAYYENIYYLQYLRVKRQVQEHSKKRLNTTNVKNNSVLKEKRNLHIMHDCVIHMPISLGLVKNSPLILHINKHLQHLIEAGLVKKWLNDAIIRIKSEEITNEKQINKALMNLEKLYGAIVALGIGYFISICILIGEVLHWQCFVKKHPFYDKYNMTLYYNRKRLLKKTKK